MKQRTYGFQLRGGQTIEVQATGMHEAIELAEAESGQLVVRGQEHAAEGHHSDFDGIAFTAAERSGMQARR